MPTFSGRRSHRSAEAACPNGRDLIGPGRRLIITGTLVGADPFKQRRGHWMVIDLPFRSVAVTMILSGAGSVGTVGAGAVKG